MLNLNCIICTELFAPSDEVYATNCGHLFHYLCLRQWLERSKSCPQCRHKCSERNIMRVYFNLANLDISSIDVCSLQEQLDDLKLKLQFKDKEIQDSKAIIKNLKESQLKSANLVMSLEKRLAKLDVIALAHKEQQKMHKAKAQEADELRRENKNLKSEIDAMECISTILKGASTETDKLLKSENNPRKLATWVQTLKRELNNCERKKTDLRNMLRVINNNSRKQHEEMKKQADRVSQLESENYQLTERLKSLNTTGTSVTNTIDKIPTTELLPTTSKADSQSFPTLSIDLNKSRISELQIPERRYTISPTIKENVRKIEESDSPYMNIKSSSIGLVPLFKRQIKNSKLLDDCHSIGKTTTIIKLSPVKRSSSDSKDATAGAVTKAYSDLLPGKVDAYSKYSILKKPRLGLVAAAASASAASFTKPLNSNLVYNGFGGSERVDPFARKLEEAEATLASNLAFSKINIQPMGGTKILKLKKTSSEKRNKL